MEKNILDLCSYNELLKISKEAAKKEIINFRYHFTYTDKSWFAKTRKYSYSKSSLLRILKINKDKLKTLDSYKDILLQKNKDYQKHEPDDIFYELNKLIGIENIKNDLYELYGFLKIKLLKNKTNMPSFHMVFFGPPGTGKTTVARIVGKIFKSLGILKKGHLVETERANLVGKYVGWTTKETNKVIMRSLDGVLFIDEAYSLIGKGEGDFGQEAIDTILKKMEDYRDRLVIIVAGYQDEMKKFLESNAGLKSRFSRYFYFQDYKPKELMEIFLNLCNNEGYEIEESARLILLNYFEKIYKQRDKFFGNARDVRKLFELIEQKQHVRLNKIEHNIDKYLHLITKTDVLEGIKAEKSNQLLHI